MPLYDDPTAPAHSKLNIGPRSTYSTSGDHSWQELRWYEAPREDPAWPEVHTYTDAISYAPGETVHFHGSTNAARWSSEITRDGLKPQVVHHAEDLPGHFTPMPKDAYKAGCHWPIVHEWELPGDLASGYYIAQSSVTLVDGSLFLQHHFFVVRPTAATRGGQAVAPAADRHLDRLQRLGRCQPLCRHRWPCRRPDVPHSKSRPSVDAWPGQASRGGAAAMRAHSRAHGAAALRDEGVVVCQRL